MVWFIDNEAACAAVIRGASQCEDVQDVVETAALTAAHLETRFWYEWIDTGANIADGLRRAGRSCPIALAVYGACNLFELEPVAWVGRSHASGLIERCRCIERWELYLC